MKTDVTEDGRRPRLICPIALPSERVEPSSVAGLRTHRRASLNFQLSSYWPSLPGRPDGAQCFELTAFVPDYHYGAVPEQ
jgi:hypothetical protein